MCAEDLPCLHCEGTGTLSIGGSRFVIDCPSCVDGYYPPLNIEQVLKFVYSRKGPNKGNPKLRAPRPRKELFQLENERIYAVWRMAHVYAGIAGDKGPQTTPALIGWDPFQGDVDELARTLAELWFGVVKG